MPILLLEEHLVISTHILVDMVEIISSIFYKTRLVKYIYFMVIGGRVDDAIRE